MILFAGIADEYHICTSTFLSTPTRSLASFGRSSPGRLACRGSEKDTTSVVVHVQLEVKAGARINVLWTGQK